jgi:NAD(P)-dependent dehydrogenase (short-subunit alcohol dehydrogenase family)
VSDASAKHRIAFVTGAGRGIGRAVARRLGADGCSVAVNDIDERAARNEVAQLRQAGVAAVAAPGDVSCREGASAAHEAVVEQLGDPQILVNNAGVISLARFCELPEREWDWVLRVNLKSAFLCSQAVLGEMRKQGWGRVVNIASDAGKTGEPWIAHYCASKFGVIGLTQSLALEFAQTGVTVNAVCPAIASTEMMERLADQLAGIADDGDVAQARHALAAEIPMGRPVHPDEVADVVSFLAGDSSRFISGQAINVSGAHEMH